MFRSEKMVLCQMFIQPEAAYTTVSELGEAGVVQFIDSNKNDSYYNRRFMAEVKLCDEMENKLRYLNSILVKENIAIRDPDPEETRDILNPRQVLELEISIEIDESRIRDPSRRFMELNARHAELYENILVLEKAEELFNEECQRSSAPPSPNLSISSDQDLSIEDTGFLIGIIERQRIPTFERMIWRISRGCAVLKTMDLDLNSIDNITCKSVFMLYFQGITIHSHILTICRGFHAKIFYYPTDKLDRLHLHNTLQSQLEDLKIIIDETNTHRQRMLEDIADSIKARRMIIKKMKAVYHTLNYFNLDISKECFIGECWIPQKRIREVTNLLEKNSSSHSMKSFLNVIDSNIIPPTYFRSNKFTEGFQSLIDAYGCCSYREVNPAFLSIITFPFLFAVMFGDMGHGLILILFGIYTILYEKKIASSKSDNEIWNLFFAGRYIILLMGLFSIYTGLIYNDIFSKSLNLFGTGWKIDRNISRIWNLQRITLDPANQIRGTYIMGLDPIWQSAQNKILFTNSYKMKISIIFGVLHMIVGICMSVFNQVNFQKKINILIEFIPRIIFFLSIFGYLCILIFLKWALYSASSKDPIFSPFCAPSILVTFINMVLMQSPRAKPSNLPYIQCSPIIFNGQLSLQRALIIIAIVCIPFMFLMPPMIPICRKVWNNRNELMRRLRTRIQFRTNNIQSMFNDQQSSDVNPLLASTSSNSNNDDIESLSSTHEESHYSLSDIFILQAIHTIEFVLSTVSHTASYLRLWALSLAHSQLSEVLWSRMISGPSHFEGPLAGVLLWASFAGWATLTITVLVLMEGLSAFLHTLRLHWVEYMSKFYTGEGYHFKPFSFRCLLENDF